MKKLTVAVIGHRIFKVTPEIIIATNTVMTDLVFKRKAKIFLYGTENRFEMYCQICLFQYVNFTRFKWKQIMTPQEYSDKLKGEYYKPIIGNIICAPKVEGSEQLQYVERNKFMIDMCDVLVAYYDKNYVSPSGGRSGTEIAVEYAKSINKDVINIFDYFPDAKFLRENARRKADIKIKQ